MKSVNQYVMKDSGVQWIGAVPEHWKVCKIKQVCRIFGRIGFRGYTQDDLVDAGEGAITLSPSNMQNGKMNFNKCNYLTWKKYYESPEIMINDGDILFVKTGSTYGKTSIVENLPMEATINPQIVVLKEIKMNNYFLYYLLLTEIVQGQVSCSVGGSTIPTLSQESISNYVIPLPPLSEQRAIADWLDAKCADIDAAIELQQRMIDKLKAYKTAVIHQAVTKGLDKKLKPTDLKDSGIKWLGMIPKHWVKGILSSYFYQQKELNFDLREQNLLSLSYGKIIDKDITTKEGLLPKSFDNYNVIQKGDIVFRLTDLQNDKRSLRTGLCKRNGIITSAYVTIRKKIELCPDFFAYLFHVYDICKVYYGLGSGVRQGLNFNELRKLPLVLPPTLAEQRAIADWLDAKCADIDATIVLKEQKQEKLKEYKKTIIFEYVTGKKQVANINKQL